jgi:hypothetical protein
MPSVFPRFLTSSLLYIASTSYSIIDPLDLELDRGAESSIVEWEGLVKRASRVLLGNREEGRKTARGRGIVNLVYAKVAGLQFPDADLPSIFFIPDCCPTSHSISSFSMKLRHPLISIR